MVRKLTLALGLAFTLLGAGDAFATAIVPTDFDSWITGPSIQPTTVDLFDVAAPPPNHMGTLRNNVYFNSSTGNYTYLETVVPTLANNQLFNTGFAAEGFTGTAGFSFSNATARGGFGAASFIITEVLGQLSWYTNFPSLANPSGWDQGETIRFFFVSTNPPGIGDYNLSTTEVGTAQSYAPIAVIPEPGSIALLGSGLVGLIAAMRRRRGLRA